MTIERMNEQISRWKEEKRVFNERMEKKISDMERERDLALAAQTQRIFAKHHLNPDELVKLKYAKKEQLQKLLAFIEDEIGEPVKPAEKPDNKNEKENEDHAKEVTT